MQRFGRRRRIVRVSACQSLYVVALLRRGLRRKRARTRDGVVGGDLAFGVNVEVDVGAERVRDAPVSHREVGVQISRALKGAHGLVVVEGVDEAQALIEELLRLRVLRRDRVMERTHAGDERRLVPVSRRMMFVLRHRRAARQKQYKQKGGELHLTTLPLFLFKTTVGLYATASRLGFN